jgi:hypothetical protein
MEYIPVSLDHHFDLTASLKINSSTERKMFAKFRVITIGVPKMDVGAS